MKETKNRRTETKQNQEEEQNKRNYYEREIRTNDRNLSEKTMIKTFHNQSEEDGGGNALKSI